MSQNNEKIKLYAKSKKVPLWKVAEQYGMHDSNFSRMLRYPLSNEVEDKIIAIIDELSK